MKRNCIKLRCLSLTRSATRSLCWTFSRDPASVLLRNVFYYSPLPVCSSFPPVSERAAVGRIKIHVGLWSSPQKFAKKFGEHSAHVSSRVLLRPLCCRLEIYTHSSEINTFTRVEFELNASIIDLCNLHISFRIYYPVLV